MDNIENIFLISNKNKTDVFNTIQYYIVLWDRMINIIDNRNINSNKIIKNIFCIRISSTNILSFVMMI